MHTKEKEGERGEMRLKI